jgi:lipid-binding SYLF domain-containing protein
MTSSLSRRSLAAGLLVTPAVLAATKSAWAEDVVDARHILEEAAIKVEQVRAELRADVDTVLQRAKGVLVIPSYYKAGFIIGGAFGDGVLTTRQPDGRFGDPAFYRMTSGSIGLQIGMHAAAILLIIQTEKGLSAVLNDEFKIGANVGMSIGTLGVGAEAATTTHVGNDIIAYSTSKGLFAGGAFEGSVIKPRKDWNAAVYGVGNDNPSMIVQRSQLASAARLADALATAPEPVAAPTAAPAPTASMPVEPMPAPATPAPRPGAVQVTPLN